MFDQFWTEVALSNPATIPSQEEIGPNLHTCPSSALHSEGKTKAQMGLRGAQRHAETMQKPCRGQSHSWNLCLLPHI
jgi:hypothetical protein